MDTVAAPMGPPGNPATPRADSSSSPPPAADDRRLLPETGRDEDLGAFPARPVSPTDSLAQLPPLPRPPLPSVRLFLPSMRLFFGLGDGPPASSGSISRTLRARLRLRFPCQEFEEHRSPLSVRAGQPELKVLLQDHLLNLTSLPRKGRRLCQEDIPKAGYPMPRHHTKQASEPPCLALTANV